MKKLFLFTILLLAAVSAYAQGRGNVFVTNSTDCDVYVDVKAVCPECTEYSSLAMWHIPPHPTWPGIHLYDASLQWPNPYWASATDPQVTCFNQWEWSHVELDFFCGGNSYKVFVGNEFSPCHNYPKTVMLTSEPVEPADPNDPEWVPQIYIPQSCLDECFNGNPIYVKWIHNTTGNIHITIGI
ncbi:MAG: hypothetical protein H3C54_07020 [Taibaiella sp.]|nr:hypothetical protein [Taibaiella sp.]